MASNLEPKINRIATAVTSALSALTAKGVTVPEGANVESLAALIESIEAGGGGGADVSPFESIRCGTFTGTEKTITIDGVSSCKIFAMRRTSTVTKECTALAILVKKATGKGYVGSSSYFDYMGMYNSGQLFPTISGDVLTFYRTLNGDYEYVMVS